MRVSCFNARRAKFLERLAIVQNVNHLRRPRQMPALDDDVARTQTMDRFCRAPHFLESVDLQSRQHARLVQIWRDHGRQRQQLFDQRGARVVAQEWVAAFRDHDRIHDQWGKAMLANFRGNRRDDRRGR